jgi:hypothetical protein
MTFNLFFLPFKVKGVGTSVVVLQVSYSYCQKVKRGLKIVKIIPTQPVMQGPGLIEKPVKEKLFLMPWIVYVPS